jgi:hypothetical protein
VSHRTMLATSCACSWHWGWLHLLCSCTDDCQRSCSLLLAPGVLWSSRNQQSLLTGAVLLQCVSADWQGHAPTAALCSRVCGSSPFTLRCRQQVLAASLLGMLSQAVVLSNVYRFWLGFMALWMVKEVLSPFTPWNATQSMFDTSACGPERPVPLQPARDTWGWDGGAESAGAASWSTTSQHVPDHTPFMGLRRGHTSKCMHPEGCSGSTHVIRYACTSSCCEM